MTNYGLQIRSPTVDLTTRVRARAFAERAPYNRPEKPVTIAGMSRTRSPSPPLPSNSSSLLADFSDSPQSLRGISRMLLGTPSLRARHLEKQLRWQELLVPDIARRLGVPDRGTEDVRAHALVASALACLDAASTAWALTDDDTPIGTLLDAAIGTVRR